MKRRPVLHLYLRPDVLSGLRLAEIGDGLLSFDRLTGELIRGNWAIAGFRWLTVVKRIELNAKSSGTRSVSESRSSIRSYTGQNFGGRDGGSCARAFAR